MAVLTHPLRRIPAFHPVPLRTRRDGWSARRQAAFIGLLVQDKSVSRAADMVERSRMSAYRLRRRPGAQEFAAVWDMILHGVMVDMAQVTRAARKVTPGLIWEHAQTGTIRPLMFRGRFVSITHRQDNSALLQHLARLNRTIDASKA